MTTLLIALCAVAFLAIAGFALIIFSPVVITVDSRRRQVRVRWLMVLEYLRPLPGSSGASGLYVFRRPLAARPLPSPGVAPARPSREPKPPEKRRFPASFLLRCLRDSHIRRALARQFSRLFRQAWRSVELTRMATDVSLPDPALNGWLAGALMQLPRRAGIRVNFRGDNSSRFELRLRPHRMLKAMLLFSTGLPYWAVFKQWRRLAAARPK